MARIRAARHYRKEDSAVRLLVQAGRVGVRRDLRGAMQHLGDKMDTAKAVLLIRHGRFRELVDVVDWAHVREVMKAPFDKLAVVFAMAAQHGAKKINGAFHVKRRAVRFRKIAFGVARVLTYDATGLVLPEGNTPAPPVWDTFTVAKAVGDRFNWDRLNDRTLDKLRADQDRFISQLEREARDTIENVVTAGLRAGLSADDIVSDIRSTIGLTDRQARAVLNYRQSLVDLDSGALRRQLRDTAYDAQVQAAIDGGRDLDDAVIDALTDRYADNYLDHRAETIANTETQRAANSGLRDAYSQAIERGALPAEAIRRYWLLGDCPCPVCEPIPDMNPDGVAVGESFDSPDGPQEEAPVHPNCECEIEYVTDLDLVPDDEGN